MCEAGLPTYLYNRQPTLVSEQIETGPCPDYWKFEWTKLYVKRNPVVEGSVVLICSQMWVMRIVLTNTIKL